MEHTRVYPTFPIPAVGAVVLHDDTVLLIQRGQAPAKGKWTLPGGVIEVGESPEESLLREVEEECQVNIHIHVKHNPAQQLVEITNTYHKPDSSVAATMHYRYIFRYEMEALLRAAGFETLHVYGGFERQPYDYHSGIMAFIAQKQGE